MAGPSPTSSGPPPDSGYVTVHLGAAQTDPDLFTFGARRQRFGGAFGASLLTHALALLLFVIAITLPTPPPIESPNRPFDLNQLVWLDVAGPGGGGGGGGNQTPEPPRKLEIKGDQKLAVAVEKAPTPAPPKEIPKPQDPPPVAINVPVKPMEAGQISMLGAVESTITAPTATQGPGTGGGAGTGRGTGSGPGTGSGLGPGSGGGTGGGVYRVGNGVTAPSVLFEQKPAYTAEAMRAKIQGEAWVTAVVAPDGTVRDVQISRSLDSVFGLDQEAVKAVRQWRFRPGMRFGQPVAVEVMIAVSFNLR